MLVISRKVGEGIILGDRVKVIVGEIRAGDSVVLQVQTWVPLPDEIGRGHFEVKQQVMRPAIDFLYAGPEGTSIQVVEVKTESVRVGVNAPPGVAVLREEASPVSPVAEQQAIELFIDPGDAPKEVIQELLESLSELHRAAGGLGLEFKVEGNQVIATKEVGK